MKRFGLLGIVFMLIGAFGALVYGKEVFPINIAVEFTDHAASAYVAKEKGWFEEEGIKPMFFSYVTGMSLAAGLGKGDIQAAYMCLLPAITAYGNAGVPVKIVAGTHRHGYGLAVNPEKVKSVKDLEKPDVRIATNRQGGPADAIMLMTIEKYGLDRKRILNKVQRMNPPMQIMAIRMGKLDAFFNCEHWPAMAEDAGFKMLLTSEDVWPHMQGSVLIVKKELLADHPEIVKKLAAITRRSISWMGKNPEEAALIMSKQLQMTGAKEAPLDLPAGAKGLEITPATVLRSMGRLDVSIEIDPRQVQKSIDFAAKQGYIRRAFKADDILDLRFINEKKN